MVLSVYSKKTILKPQHVKDTIGQFFTEKDYTGKRIIVIIPDNTRSGPVGLIFQLIYEHLVQKAEAVDCLVALGTHQPLSEEQICKRLDITLDQRKAKYGSVKFINHQWKKSETFISIGNIPAEEISELSEDMFAEDVNVAINKLIFDYDEIFILGPVFPHEVVGFSGGHKYIFPGIAGSEIINFFHWLGAIFTNLQINGNKWTPTRKVVEKAASFIKLPRTLFAIVSVHHELNGLFIGDPLKAWEKAADLSAQLHIVYKDRPYKTVLGIAPKMYDDMWTAAKVMYKLESIVADGGTLIIYAPHIDEISYTHRKYLDQVGYHTRDYFLKQMDKFKDVPRAVLAHSTHLKGIGKYINGIEEPRINVVLATKIPKERCEKLNLGYMDPEKINFAEFENKEDEGVLLVLDAGEILYRLKN
ncbi:MAG: lactate racemase domain-containing protein [Planctomycetota bacterium]|jgi:nickel-dependent lactate racemase